MKDIVKNEGLNTMLKQIVLGVVVKNKING